MTEKNSAVGVDWLYLPSIPFDIIMKKIAHESLPTLRSCLQVCSAWNVMIEADILKNSAVMDIIRDKFEVAFGSFHLGTRPLSDPLPSSEEITDAKWLSDKNLLNIEVIEKFAVFVTTQLDSLNCLSLTTCAASHGLLGQCQSEEESFLDVLDIDLTSVPTEHFAALASWVTSWCTVSIKNVSGINLASFLNGLDCADLWIYYQSLGREETRALVQAMETGVERVHLGSVTLEMETLLTYSGQGRCLEVMLQCCEDDPEVWKMNVKEPLKNWAQSRDWAVINDKKCSLFIER